jgi:hypothetical protein
MQGKEEELKSQRELAQNLQQLQQSLQQQLEQAQAATQLAQQQQQHAECTAREANEQCNHLRAEISQMHKQLTQTQMELDRARVCMYVCVHVYIYIITNLRNKYGMLIEIFCNHFIVYLIIFINYIFSPNTSFCPFISLSEVYYIFVISTNTKLCLLFFLQYLCWRLEYKIDYDYKKLFCAFFLQYLYFRMHEYNIVLASYHISLHLLVHNLYNSLIYQSFLNLSHYLNHVYLYMSNLSLHQTSVTRSGPWWASITT